MQKHKLIDKYFLIIVAVILLIVLLLLINYFNPTKTKRQKIDKTPVAVVEWTAPDTSTIPYTQEGEYIRYGRNLILNTAYYLGPRGAIAQISNGMNCDNCHIEAGTRIWGNNFSMAHSTYPLYRNRSSSIETIEMRINNCFERSLNGKKIRDSSREMIAMVSYINWLGKNVPKGAKTRGSGFQSLPFLERAADSARGRILYALKCQSCHGSNGEGKPDNYNGYIYPPLWGNNSYNTGAGMYQVSKLAGYIKNNMPFGANYKSPFLTVEESWDIAAFINSNPRPEFKNLKNDWKHISTKPFDYPYGPYSDIFPARQHKYGPFKPIVLAQNKK